MTGERSTDFIWAVKLAKITKNGLQKDWTIESVVGRDGLLGRRATFSADAGDSPFNPMPVLMNEGLGASEVEVSLVESGKEEYYISVLDEAGGEQDKEADRSPAASQCAPGGQGGVSPGGFRRSSNMVLA